MYLKKRPGVLLNYILVLCILMVSFLSVGSLVYAADLPDLIVTNVTWTPANPTAGDEVTFSATIKNQGAVATPNDGSGVGIAFLVDDIYNNVVSWADTTGVPLAAGESVTITANGGPAGKATWTAIAGVHNFSAMVDVVHAVTESDEGNNRYTGSITVSGDVTPPPTPGQWTPPSLPNDYTPIPLADENGNKVWPDATNTGVPTGTVLTTVFGAAQSPTIDYGGVTYDRMPYAPVVIDQDNTVFENKEVYGGLEIRAKNVVVRNCKIISDYAHNAMENVNGTGVIVVNSGASAIIERCTLNGSDGTHAGVTYVGNSLMALGNNIANVNDGIFCWQTKGTTESNNFVIQDNYMHDFTDKTANGHIDGFQTEGSCNGVVNHNNFDVNFGQNACVAIWNTQGNSDNILVENNLMAGGGFTVYCEDYDPSEASPAGGFYVSNCRFVDNAFSTKYFSKCGSYGVWYSYGPTDGWNNAPDSGKSYRSGNYVLDGENAGQIIDTCNPGDISLPPSGAGEWYNTGDGDFPGGEHILGTDNTGIVTTEFDITPVIDNADSGMGYTDSSATAGGWSGLAVIFKLNSTGFFDCRDGTTYPLEELPTDTPADQVPPTAMRYTAGSTYHVRIVMDLYTQTYDAFVTSLDSNGNPTGNPFQVAKNYRFRTSAAYMDDAGKCYTAAGTLNAYIVSNHMVVPTSWKVGITNNTSVHKLGTKNTGDANGVVVAKFDMTPNSNNYEYAIGYMDGDNDFANPSSGFSAFSRWNIFMLFNDSSDGNPADGGTQGTLGIKNGGSLVTSDFAFTPGVKYHVKITANLKTRKFNVWIAPEGGAEVLIAQDFAFRMNGTTDTPAIDDLGTAAAFSDFYDSSSAPMNDLMQVTNHNVIDNSSFTAAIAAVNSATTADEMKAALLSSALGLSLDGYFLVSADEQDAVINIMLNEKGDGYADDLAVQEALDRAVVNSAPVIAPIAGQNTDEGTTLQFNVTASDVDGDSMTLSASGLPDGAAFNAVTGEFTWTPGYVQSGSYAVHFIVSDSNLTSEIDVTIAVRNVAAQELTLNLTDYVNGSDINKLMKNLLVRELGDVASALDKQQYKLALIKLKVFQTEVKILDGKMLTDDQAEIILKSSLDICRAIVADAQGKDKSWVDNKVNSIMEMLDKFKAGRITDDICDSIMQNIDDLVNKMK